LPTSLDDNLDVLRAGKSIPIDVVLVRRKRARYFVNVSAGGFSGAVDKELTPKIKRTWGPRAYVRGAATALPNLHAYRTTIVLDSTERFSLEVYNVILANGRFVAGGLPIAPRAKLDDGLLDVILIPKRSAAQIAVLAAEILLGRHLGSEGVIFRRAANVRVKSRPGMWFNIDGELIGPSPAVFQVCPGALDFIATSNEL
jgi:diacylglycerol kinase (ATP)